MSTQKGNTKKKGQRYQNEFGFKHNKNSMLTRKIQETPLDFLCSKCLNILEWKIKFRKYKPLSTPSKCKICELKTVYKGHREACDKCCIEIKICSKCLDKCEEYARPTRSSKVLRDKNKMNNKKSTFDEIVSSLKEKHKRTVNRKIESGEDLIFDGTKGIVNKKTNEIIVDLIDINSGVLVEDNSIEEKEEDDYNEESVSIEDNENSCEISDGKIEKDNKKLVNDIN